MKNSFIVSRGLFDVDAHANARRIERGRAVAEQVYDQHGIKDVTTLTAIVMTRTTEYEVRWRFRHSCKIGQQILLEKADIERMISENQLVSDVLISQAKRIRTLEGNGR